MGLGSPRVERIRRRSHLSAAALVLVLLASIPLLRTLRVRAMDHYLATQRYEDVYYLPPAQWLPVFSLGYREAAANLVWMRGLVYYGEEMVHRGGVQHVLDYGEAIVTLDPDFKAAYRWVNMAGLYNARQELTREDVERTITFLERGVRRFPDDGDLAWEMGATLAYELAPRVDDPDEKQRIHARATDYLMVAARKGAAPPWLALSNAGQLMRLGRTEQAARHLEEMYATVQDPETRERIRQPHRRPAHPGLRRGHARGPPRGGGAAARGAPVRAPGPLPPGGPPPRGGRSRGLPPQLRAPRAGHPGPVRVHHPARQVTARPRTSSTGVCQRMPAAGPVALMAPTE
jgi:hypothetical protein